MQEVRLEQVDSEFGAKLMRPVLNVRVPAGFPSPADDYLEERIDLTSYLNRHPTATFYYWVDGNSMIEAGIFDGDLIVVDNSITPQNNDIVLAVINAEMTLKQIKIAEGKTFLIPRNVGYKPIELTEYMNFEVRGVVVCNIHFHKRPYK